MNIIAPPRKEGLSLEKHPSSGLKKGDDITMTDDEVNDDNTGDCLHTSDKSTMIKLG